MKMRPRALQGWIVGLGVLLAGVLTGCGSGSESDSGSASPKPAAGRRAATPAVQAEAAPEAGAADESAPRAAEIPLPPDLTPFPDVDYTNLPIALGLMVGAVRQQAASNPGDPMKTAELGSLYYVHGFPDAAATCFQRAAQLDRSTFLWDYCRGLALQKAGKTEEAIAAMQSVVQRDPKFQLAHARLAQLYDAQGQAAAAQAERDKLGASVENIVAMDVIERGMRRNGRDPRVLLDEAVTAARRGDFLHAENYVADALRSDENDPTARATRALVRAMEGKTGEAEKDLREILKQHPDHVFAKQALARVLAVVGQIEESEKLFRSVLESDPTNMEAISGLVMVLKHEKRDGEIDPLLTHALQAGADNAQLHYDVGETYAGLGRDDEAIAAFRKALELQPTMGAAHFRIGQLEAQQGKVDAASAEWEKAVDVQPTLSQARLALIGVVMQAGQYERAIQLAGEGVALAPDSVQMLNTQAWLLATAPREALRDPKRAVETAERAAQLTNHGDFEVLDTLAASYASAGKFVEARRAIAQAIEVAQLRRAQLTGGNNMSQVQRITPLLEKYKERQALYEADKPYYEGGQS